MFAGMQDRGIKDVAMVYDEKVLSPAIEALYYENYELDDALEYIGDVKIKARGSAWLLTKQTQAVRLSDFGRMIATSPVFQNRMGKEGLTYYLRESAKSLNLEGRRLVPEEEFTKPIPEVGPVAPAQSPTPIDQAGNKIQGAENLVTQPSAQGG